MRVRFSRRTCSVIDESFIILTKRPPTSRSTDFDEPFVNSFLDGTELTNRPYSLSFGLYSVDTAKNTTTPNFV